MCDKLWCKEKDGGKTMSFGTPPAEGTKCGTDKWCFNKTCVMIGARPQAVNGEWGEWGKWSPCSRTCGGGVEVRERLCDNPQPSNKGRYCSGKRSEYNMCNTQECTDNSGPTFRELQCTEFDKKPFEGVLHTWKPYKAPDSDPNPCALYCLSNDGVYTKLAPRVKDGTRCKPGTRDTCIQGACMPVGCDWKIASEAVEDVCGICDGDGTHCTVVEDVFKGVPTTGYAPIATVPKGAMNVKLAEVHPSDNMIAVTAIDNQTYYLNGGYTEGYEGEYNFGNTKGIYTKPGKDMDELNIKGPLTEPLVLYVCLFADTNPGVHYSYAMPSDTPTYTPKYRWDFVEWGPCSAQCGGGTQVMLGICMEEKNGKVKPSLCEGIPKKEPRARTCNDKPCRTRWKVWKWGPCSGCLYQSGTRTRQVECVKENPTNTGDEEIITEASECCGEPPKKFELCNSSRPCPKNMTSGIVKKREMEVMPIEEMIVKRDSGKSFSDGANSSRVNATIQDHVQTNQVHLEEVILEDTKLNLTEKEFEEVGDKLSEKRLSCPLQTLTGQDAMDRIEQLIHGEDYVRNKTKSNNNHKETSKSSNSSAPKTQESPHHEENIEKCNPS
ncbi:hypothetical protein J6590_025687 [Homalodisca vitripennis]|nr:hypothetical protein J6590_025687 [Homalodisca vitripennis]